MKAYISPKGDVTVWLGALASSYDGFFLDITEAEKPATQEGHQVGPGPLEITRENGVPVAVSTSWVQVPIPLVPKGKLAIGDRMTEAEFDGLEALMDSLLTSEDSGQRRMAKRWHRAIEIDPNDPETAAGLQALVGMGVITTPLNVIFAP
jgi:hypothetical protein